MDDFDEAVEKVEPVARLYVKSFQQASLFSVSLLVEFQVHSEGSFKVSFGLTK